MADPHQTRRQLQPTWTAAQLHTTPFGRAAYRVVSVLFEATPVVLYVVERSLLFAAAVVLKSTLWRVVAGCLLLTWWAGLVLYMLFGGAADTSVLAGLNRRPGWVRVAAVVCGAPALPVVVWGVGFVERLRLYKEARRAAPYAGVQGPGDTEMGPPPHRPVGISLADDVGQGRVPLASLPPDLGHSLLRSFIATRLDLHLLDSAPGHALFVFSALTGALPLVLLVLIMHAIVSGEDLLLLNVALVVALWSLCFSAYRIARTFSVRAFCFAVALIHVDVFSAGYNIGRLLANFVRNGAEQYRMLYTFNEAFSAVWAAKALAMCLLACLLYLRYSYARLRYGRVPQGHRVWHYAKGFATTILLCLAFVVAVPAFVLASECIKLTTIVIFDALNRPDPEYTPVLAGLFAFVSRHTDIDGDTRDERVKHVMLSAARARKDQLMRVARNTPGGDMSAAAIAVFKVCECIEAVAARPDATAFDIVLHDNIHDAHVGLAIIPTTDEPFFTQARCVRLLVAGHLLSGVVSTVLPFVDVAFKDSSFPQWVKFYFVVEIILWLLSAAILSKRWVAYGRFRTETNRLTQLFPNAADLSMAWRWIERYRPPQDSSGTASRASTPKAATPKAAVFPPLRPPLRSLLPGRVVSGAALRLLEQYLPPPCPDRLSRPPSAPELSEPAPQPKVRFF